MANQTRSNYSRRWRVRRFKADSSSWISSSSRIYLSDVAQWRHSGRPACSSAWQWPSIQSGHLLFYTIRLGAFVLLIVAVVDKNWRSYCFGRQTRSVIVLSGLRISPIQ